MGTRPWRPGWPLITFAALTTIGLFAVVVLGFVDTATDSALGCGRSFPLCNGSLLPTANIHALIEWSHRVLAAIVGLMVGALAIWAWIRGWRHMEVRVLGLIALGFIFIESAVGAMAVLIPESDAVIAVHLGIALTAFAATALLTAWLRALGRGAGPPARPPVPPRLAAWAWGSLIFLYAVIYLGAYVAGTGAAAACLTWPLCPQGPTLSLGNPVTIDYLHRAAALAVGAVAVCLYVQARAIRAIRPDLARLGAALLVLVIAQIASGLLLVESRLALSATILHVMLVTALFTVLSAFALGVLPEVGWRGRGAPATPRAQR